ncbi:MAG: class I SAM-dependent methyltransferase [Ilumatobacteraceae bacterium]
MTGEPAAGEPAAANAAAFYAALAPSYDLEFLAPHRRTYDRLAWEAVTACFVGRPAPLRVVDIGCGTGRWARVLVAAGHEVIGIEPCAEMAAATKHLPAGRFTLQPCSVDDAEVADGWADLVIAMGSLQYAPDPAAAIARAARWLTTGGVMAVLVDSLGGLVLELVARGDREQAALRAATHRARWQRNGLDVEYHLFDSSTLDAAMTAAGLEQVELTGLLVSSSVCDRDALGFEGRDLEIERALSHVPSLTDGAKQLLAIGRRA